MVDIDLTADYMGVEFKNPLILGMAGLCFPLRYIQKAINAGIAGIALKGGFEGIKRSPNTTSMEESGPRPYMVSLRKLGMPGGDWYGSELRQFTKAWVEHERPEVIKLAKANNVRLGAGDQGGEEGGRWAAEMLQADWIQSAYSCPVLAGQDPYTNYPTSEECNDWREKQYGTRKNRGYVKYDYESFLGAKKTGLPVDVKIGSTRDLGVIPEKARLLEKLGADGLCPMNYFSCGVVIDVDTETLWGWPSFAGYHLGRAFKPVALYTAAECLINTKLPVSGIGGIWTARDALEFLLLGCSTVQLCSGVYMQGWKRGIADVLDGIKKWMDEHGYGTIKEFKGKIMKDYQAGKYQAWGEYKYQNVDTSFNGGWISPTPIFPVIDQQRCTFCGDCQSYCVYEAITVDTTTNQWRHRRDYCQGCGMCVSICPVDCLSLQDDQNRVVWSGKGYAKTYFKM